MKGGSGKVVASKPNDRIFLYYSDHGGPGVLGEFPTCFNALIVMHQISCLDKLIFFQGNFVGLIALFGCIRIEEDFVNSRVRPHQFSI